MLWEEPGGLWALTPNAWSFCLPHPHFLLSLEELGIPPWEELLLLIWVVGVVRACVTLVGHEGEGLHICSWCWVRFQIVPVT